MIKDNRPRYWANWFDRWHLLLLLLLVVLLGVLVYMTVIVRPAPTVLNAPGAGQALVGGQPVEITGSGQPGAAVEIFDGDKLLGQAQTDAAGNWKFVMPAADPGIHNLKAVADVAGTRSESASVALNVAPASAAGPTAVALAATATVQPTETLVPPTATPVPPTATSVPPIVTATAVPPTATPVPPTATPVLPTATSVPATVAATAVPPTATRVVPTATLFQPAATTIPATVAAMSISPVILSPSNGDKFAGGQPLGFSGTAAPASLVSLLIDGKAVGTASTDASGKWGFKLTDKVSTGVHEISVSATGADGKTVMGTAPSVKVDIGGTLLPTTGDSGGTFIFWMTLAWLLIVVGIVLLRR